MPVVKVMGTDKQPQSSNFDFLPEEIAAATLAGLGQSLPEFEVHEFVWEEKPLTMPGYSKYKRSHV